MDIPVSGRNLFVVTFCALFLEMACIRWLNATVQVLAYFTNLVLVSAFLGLGAGSMMLRSRRGVLAWFPWVFLAMAAATLALSRLGFTISYSGDVMFAEASVFSEQEMRITIPLSAVTAFFLNSAFFFTLGHELGHQLAGFSDALEGYAYDIAGSVSGTLAFACMSWLETPPWMWFLAGMTPLLILLRGSPRLLLVGGMGVAACVQVTTVGDEDALWSPYYRVETRPYSVAENKDLGFMILVNNLRIQDALRFGPELAQSDLQYWIRYYQLPYVVKNASRVLVLGAGSGNDVVVAKASGAREVHAVEIDPVLARMGASKHPNLPYTLPGVTVHVEDARAFLSRTTETFDLVVMSALDSHKQVGGTGSIRLESFVYTRESFEQVRRRLAPGGVFVLHLSSSRPWMGRRTFKGLTEAFGKPPLAIASRETLYGDVAYVSTDTGQLPTAAELAAHDIAIVAPPDVQSERVATDDWPFLYLESNSIPPVNMVVMLGMLAIALVATRGSMVTRAGNRAHFFLLGAGFMLLETASITRMAVLFGTTWYVSAFVVASILVAVFIANALTRARRGITPRFAYPALLVSNVACYAVPLPPLLLLEPVVRMLAGAVLVGVPVIFASFIFSSSFRDAQERDKAFGANLLGVVLGGCLEYLGNITGLSALYLVAATIYVASWLVRETTPTMTPSASN